MRKIISFSLSFFMVLMPFVARADNVQVTLSSGDVIDLSATIPALFEINQITNGVIISMKGGSFLTVTSLSTKELFVQPSIYGSGKICSPGASSVLVSVPASVPIADVTILLGNNKCGVSPTPTPSPTETVSVTPTASPIESTSATPASTISNNQQPVGGYPGTPEPSIAPIQGEGNAFDGRVFGNLVDNTNRVGAVLAVAGTIATISTLMAVYLAELGQIFQTFETFKFWLLYILGLRKKKPWGIVYNKYLAKPIPQVVVEVFDTEYKKLRDTQLTDKDGRFMFTLDKGEYFLKFKKEGFESFQTQFIKVEDASQPVFLNIEIIPERFYDLASSAVGKSKRFLAKLRDLLVKINPFILLGGTILTIYNIAIDPSSYNYFILFVYIVFDCIQLYYLIHLSRSFGIITDSTSGQPLDLAVVRLFDHQRQLLLFSKTSDKYGRFSFLVNKGEYYVTVFKSGFVDYHSEKLYFSHDDVLNEDIRLTRAN